MKKLLIIIILIITVLASIVYFEIYYIKPPIFAKSEIQKSLNETYKNRFEIDKIKIQHSPDLFHQPTGYSLILKDSLGITFGNIYIQETLNKNGWTTYMGSDILEEYRHAKLAGQKEIPKFKFDTTKTERIDDLEE